MEKDELLLIEKIKEEKITLLQEINYVKECL